MPEMINVVLAIAEGALTGDILWLSIVFGEIPRQKSRGVGEVQSQHDEGIPLRCSGAGRLLYGVSSVRMLFRFHSLVSNSIRRVSMVACAELFLQKGTG